MTDPPTAQADSFRFVEARSCVCGADVAQGGRVVQRRFHWGCIRFVQCSRCSSWVQSPRVSDESRRRWFDSDAYQQAARAGGDGPYLDYESDEPRRVAEARWRYRSDLAPALPPAARVLEVGCATGSVVSVLTEAGHDVTGVDLSDEFITHGRHLYPQCDLRACDVRNLELPKGSLDAVLTIGTAITLPDFRAFLFQARDLLRPGGLLYFNFPTSDSLLARICGASHQTVAPSVSVRMSRLGCRLALESTGFVVEHHRMDRQMPSLSKVLGYTRLGQLFPIAQRLGVADRGLPFPLPALGVHVYWARTF